VASLVADLQQGAKDASAEKSSKLVPDATLKVYPGAPHGLAATHKDEFNADLLAFIRA
jgi:non-heme chloroperoxidase